MQYLAILKIRPDAPRESLGPLAKPEAAKAWEMLAAGVLRSAHYIEGPAGAVLVLEAASRAEAERHINALPLVAHGLLSVELLTLTPFTGFSALFAAPTA